MLRVGLSGCGAVSQLYYGPALRTLEAEGRLTVAGFFDPDQSSAALVASPFPAARVSTAFEDLLSLGLDLVIVAAPPRFHAPQAIAALESGAAVHCEKPLALSAAEGERMLEAARASGGHLSVGLMRRSFPAVRAIARLLDNQLLGALQSVDVFEGGAFDWPVRSPHYFSVDESGGGVLRDIGPHALDLLTGWLGTLELRSYEDDARGGVEANCRAEVTSGGVPCALRLSRDWARPNRYLFKGERGWLSWVPYEPDRVEVGIAGSPIGNLNVAGTSEGCPDVTEPQEMDFAAAFTGALREVIAGLGSGEITRRTLGLDTLELIDRCYDARRPMSEAWWDAAPATKCEAAQ